MRISYVVIITQLMIVLNTATAEEFSGRVVRIVDGDSIVVLRDREQVNVRLEGIDCPEFRQAFGNKAKQATSALAFGKTVTVNVTGKDRFDRTLAVVILPDEKSLNQELVRRGYAWWFRRYSDDETLATLESEARKAKLGLWNDARALAPWDWRAIQRAKTDLPPADVEVVDNGVRIVALLPNPQGKDSGNEQVTISNATTEPVSLAGWKLIDKAGNVFLLAVEIPPGRSVVITMTEPTMPLNNNGDTVVLLDADGVGRSRAKYGQNQVVVGKSITFVK